VSLIKLKATEDLFESQHKERKSRFK